MSESAFLLLFYENEQSARADLRLLRRWRFGRAAMVSRSPDGRTRTEALSPRLIGTAVGVAVGLAVGLLGAVLVPALAGGGVLGTGWAWAVLGAAAGVGAVGGWLGGHVLRPVVDPELLDRYGRVLVADETLLIVQAARPGGLARATALLRASSERQLAIFPMHAAHPAEPGRGRAGGEQRDPDEAPPGEPLVGARLAGFARRLAGGHVAVLPLDRGRPEMSGLLDRLDDCERTIERVRGELSEAAQLEQSISQASEWLLDNAYIIQTHIDQVRRNLTGQFRRSLPLLRTPAAESRTGPGGRADRSGQVRVYALARALVEHTDARLDSEVTAEFLSAYQQVCPLTSAELWAVPLMLRIALIEAIERLASQSERRLYRRERADFWANRLLTAARRDPDQLLAILAELARSSPDADAYFAFQLTGHLYDEETALVPVQSWIERKLRRGLGEVIGHEQGRLAVDHVSIANAVTSLRQLALVDWRDVFESQSPVEQVLRQDPARVYARMDFDTRDRYRHAVEEIAAGARRAQAAPKAEAEDSPILGEADVARLAVEMASAAPRTGAADGDPRPRHVGYYLIDEGRTDLERRAASRPGRRVRAIRWVYRHHTAVYLGAVGAATVLVLAVALAVALWAMLSGEPAGRGVWSPPVPGVLLAVALLAVFPAGELAIQTVNYLATRLLPVRTPPKMNFVDARIPDNCRALVVVPMMLTSQAGIAEQVARLQTAFLANPDPNLRFALFGDFVDAPEPTMPGDDELLASAIAGIEELNSRHGPDRFLLLHRGRSWTESEQSWIGWERKRGKLEELNRLLVQLRDGDGATGQREGQGQGRGRGDAETGGPRLVVAGSGAQHPSSSVQHPARSGAEDGPARGHPASDLVRVGDPKALADIRYVITLDADTQLPRGTGRRLVATMAHPLNRPRLSPDGRVVVGGYTIIQPRVSTSLPSATATGFARIFTDPTGTDPYTKAVSDVYQDLAGEGAYHGKGIYDPFVFHRVLDRRFADQTLLSHDLIEGGFVRTGLASDIELLDEFPPNYLAWSAREHRWIRGDWQIAGFCLPRAPGGKDDPHRVRNPLSGLNRWKIFDNLRRSLLAPAALGLLLLGWMTSPALAVLAGVAVAGVLLFAPFALLGTWLTSWPIKAPPAWPQLRTGLLRAAATAMLLPHMAGVCVDAVVRVGWRKLVSGRRLLQWTTAAMAHRQASAQLRSFLLHMGLVSVLAIGLGAFLAARSPRSWIAAAPWLGLWAISPLAGWWLNRRPRRRAQGERLAERDLAMLRRLARRTWGYFDDFVDAEHNFLPPDNYQVSHRDEPAQRTSPTNIGLWLLSGLAAHDLGYLGCDELFERTGATFDTLDKLERHEGHLLNWYDTQTLSALRPRYVSLVDSGNLIGCLWTFARGVEELLDRPLLGSQVIDGLADTLNVLLESLSGGPSVGDDQVGRALAALRRLLCDPSDPPRGLDGLIGRVRASAEPAGVLASRLGPPRGESAGEQSDGATGRLAQAAGSEAGYWAGRLGAQVRAVEALIDRYLPWAEILTQPPPEAKEELAELGPHVEQTRRRALAAAPSLANLARGHVPPVRAMLDLRAAGQPLSPPLVEWLTRLSDAFDRARWLAGEMLPRARELAGRADRLADAMDLRFLYDPARRLFAVGYNVTENRRDGSFYDLLASEARLASFIAIARDEVPLEHWLAMARPYRSVRGRKALVSWSGTMFEYLMPLLLQRRFDNSLLDQACRAAVTVQIDYARRRGLPWGISESAFSALDANRTYQYKAFGVPALGLKRGLDDDLVVAPYASALALPIAPRAVVRNLRRLAAKGLAGPYGLFESIDYSRQRSAGGERGVIVHAFMAHHQGMILLSVGNLLTGPGSGLARTGANSPSRPGSGPDAEAGGAMVRRFAADPRVRAAESLLFERIPHAPPTFQVSARERGPERFAGAAAAPPASRFRTADTDTPKTQLLSNGRYSVMVTNAGGGYSRWLDADLTRWRADTTADNFGSFCYLRDLETGRFWSNAFHPVGRQARGYTVSFPVDRAEFRRSDGGIETLTEIAVSPQDDAEIRRVTLVNRSGRPRTIELTSYLELALAAHPADRAHPAFSKLFVQTRALPLGGGAEQNLALLAWRRKRDPDEPSAWAGHLLTVDPDGAMGQAAGTRRPRSGQGQGQADPMPNPQHPSSSIQFETDRRAFIGRGRNLADPRAMHGELSGSSGAVLDPIFSLRRRFTLGPGQRVRLAAVTVAADSEQQVRALIDKYADPRMISRALELAWTKAHLELRHLRVGPEEAQRFQQLASHVLYPSSRLRPPTSRLRQNRLGQTRLWPHGISGDEPIVVVAIEESRDVPLVREVLLAHTFWRLRGLRADLVILNEESGGYEPHLHEQLTRMIQGHSMHTGVDVPGGVFLRRADQLVPEDVTLLLSAARVVLVATRGPLAQQFSTPGESVEVPPPLGVGGGLAEEPSPPLPFMELPYFNGLGGFTPDGREYAVYLGPGGGGRAPDDPATGPDQTPAPWANVLANPTFGALLSESGSGFVWSGNSQSGRLTAWSNDPVIDPACEAVYIRDEDSGVFWTPTPLPIRELDAYRARHGAGYTVFEHNSHAIAQELLVFVPADEKGGEPVRVQRLRLRSCSSRRRRLTVTFYVEWTLGADRETNAPHVVSAYDAKAAALFARNAFAPGSGDRVAFATTSPPPRGHTADRTMFLGRNRGPDRPAAMARQVLSRRTGAGVDPCAAVQVAVELQPGQTVEVLGLLGRAASEERARELIGRFRDPGRVEDALLATGAWWDRTLGAVQVATPDQAVNFLLNRWLLYQTIACRMWGRSGFYQSGGAFGFRDQLQDALACLYSRPELAREQILRSAGRQFVEGDVQHWWHPGDGAGVRTRCSDDMLWLPLAACHYVRVTGDSGILDHPVRFLHGPQLADDQHEVLFVPEPSDEQAPLFEHCRRAIERGLTAGPHGLPLFGSGDWNDGLSRVGIGGRGESVWLGWFLIVVLNDFAELCEQRGEAELADRYRRRAAQLAENVEQHAWDGAWYTRGTFDDGSPLGSAKCAEAQIDSLPQSWAVISGAGDPDRARQAMQSAWDRLVRADNRLALLFDPPFDRSEPDPGYVRSYPPGVRENGGQYTHAALWMAMAAARMGDGDRAVALLDLLNPVQRTRQPDQVQRYCVEPYVVAADVYSAPDHVGQGGWTWYTGSAGWMYRVWIEEVLGLRKRGRRLQVDPVIASDWDEFRIEYRHGQTTYDIHVTNPDHVCRGVVAVELDGEPVDGPEIVLADDGERHAVRVVLGRPAAPPPAEPSPPQRAERPPIPAADRSD